MSMWKTDMLVAYENWRYRAPPMFNEKNEIVVREEDPSDNMENTSIDSVSADTELTYIDDDVLKVIMSIGNGYPSV